VTTPCMSLSNMVVFTFEPNDEDVLFIHLWSNMQIDRPVKC
jgi:hypothetical protein